MAQEAAGAAGELLLVAGVGARAAALNVTLRSAVRALGGRRLLLLALDPQAARIGAEARVPIGVCLDTCHAFAGDPAAAADPTGWVSTVRERLGGIDLLHVNDSAVEAGGGRDNHAALGDGEMGDALAAMVVAAEAPAALLETPGDDDRRRRDLDWLRSVVSG